MLLTRSPLIHPASWASSFDLHVLSTPPAFVLSQDQTLRQKYLQTSKTGRRTITKHISRLAHQKVNKSKQTTTQPPLTQHPRKDTKQTETRTAIQTNMASKFTNTLLSSQTTHHTNQPNPKQTQAQPRRGNLTNLHPQSRRSQTH